MKSKIVRADVIADAEIVAGLGMKYAEAGDYATAVELFGVVINLKTQADCYPKEA